MLQSDNCSNLFDSVVRLTRGRDRQALERALLETLSSILAAESIILLKPDRAKRGGLYERLISIPEEGYLKYLNQVELGWGEVCIEADDAMNEAATTGELAVVPSAADNRYIFPIKQYDSRSALLIVVAQELSEEQKFLAKGFLDVHANFVRILDENEHDSLTGLLNRKTFDSRISEIVAAYDAELPAADQLFVERRQHNPELSHWLGVLDIDHFKRINDAYGHLYGDEVLLLFSGLMEKSFRSNDLLFRYGGEEFVVVLSPSVEKDALHAFERFRQAVESFSFAKVGRVTVSIGVVQITKSDFPSVVVSQADQALYYAKEHGRNQVSSYNALVKRGELEPLDTGEDIELF